MSKREIRNYGIITVKEQERNDLESIHVSAYHGHGTVSVFVQAFPQLACAGITVQQQAHTTLSIAQTEDLIGMLQDAIHVARGDA